MDDKGLNVELIESLLELKHFFEINEDDYEDFEYDFDELYELNFEKDKYTEFLYKRSKTSFGIKWAIFRGLMFKLVPRYVSGNFEFRTSIQKLLNDVHFDILSIIKEQTFLIQDSNDVELAKSLYILFSMNNSKGISVDRLMTLSNLKSSIISAELNFEEIIEFAIKHSNENVVNDLKTEFTY